MYLKPIITLVFVVVFLGFMNKCLNIDHQNPNVEFIPEMVHSIPYNAFSPNPNFLDGKTLQQPAIGSIARGFMPEFSNGEMTEEAAGELLINPFELGEANLIRGKFIYETFCQVCHGIGGIGDGPVTKRGVPPPPSIINRKVKDMKDGQIYHIISNGKGNMASYRSQILREDRWKVIHYLRTLGE